MAGCSQEQSPGPREGETAQELTSDVSGNVDLDTADVGGRISLTGDVVRVLTPGTFEISPADGATTRPVLVLGAQPDLTPGQAVQEAARCERDHRGRTSAAALA